MKRTLVSKIVVCKRAGAFDYSTVYWWVQWEENRHTLEGVFTLKRARTYETFDLAMGFVRYLLRELRP